MNKKPHLLESSEEEFSEARNLKESDPKTATRFNIAGHHVLACYYLANNNENYKSEIEITTKLKHSYIQEYNEKLSPSEQIEYTVLCLAINNISRAIEFCSLETDYSNSHKFDILLNCILRKVLEIPLIVQEPKYTPTKTENGLFQALENISKKIEVDWKLLHKYWSATHSKRYQYTIFEDFDLFSMALKNIEKRI